MRAPDFWEQDNGLAVALTPLAWLWGAAAGLRRAITYPTRLPVPVVCVGNLVVGGAGKTPLAMALGRYLLSRGNNPHFLSRGYGGRERGPVRVDPSRHDARDVGDEPLLLSATAPTWVARNRGAGAHAAVAAGADIIVMDDGFQNPSIIKDLSIIAVDGGYGFGNARLMPAGPLRERLASGLSRADAVVVIGSDGRGARNRVARYRPVFEAHLVPVPEDSVAGQPVFAFAGIARPVKFHATLRQLGCSIVGTRDFADHHRYRPDEIMRLCEDAAALGALPVTTEKDFARLPAEARPMVRCVRVELEWADKGAPGRLLAKVLGDG
jgi:tetraacyldisaccharide 4'-kinase